MEEEEEEKEKTGIYLFKKKEKEKCQTSKSQHIQCPSLEILFVVYLILTGVGGDAKFAGHRADSLLCSQKLLLAGLSSVHSGRF